MTASAKLSEIQSEIERCQKCGLYKTRITPVPGEGPVTAEIIFVGEAPGAKEDELGRPFVGRSGELLTEVLSEAGIECDTVFITSVLKSRPPNNRKPASKEIEACLPYLHRQIALISPKVIVLMGSVAVTSLIGPWKMKDAHGKFHESADGHLYFMTYHPAAALRFPKYKDLMKEDIKKLKASLN